MCALIAMSVFSTAENKKDDCLDKTLNSLNNTVDFNRHRLILSVNGYTEETKRIFTKYNSIISMIIYNMDNLGTAEAINKAWRERKPGEHAIKMDDDVVIHQSGWADLMEEVFRRDHKAGICGLKRKDCWERPYETHEDKHSELIYLPQIAGERCIIVERARHIMGTCQMYNSELLEKIGFLFQGKGVKYGHDDVLASWRSHVAGFKNLFIPYIEIDHIDPGDTPYQHWKERIAGEQGLIVRDIVHEYLRGERDIYYNPFV